MIFFIIILFLLVFSAADIAPQKQFHSDYLAKDNIQGIKGIFIILILFSHGRQYLDLTGTFDKPYMAMQAHLGQMVVAMFLFYSGYGIMEQIKKKDWGYIRTLPTKRFFGVLINFDLALGLYYIMNVCFGTVPPVKTVLRALIGFNSIGNSSWYIFDMLVLYLLTFLAFLPAKFLRGKGRYIPSLIIISALTIGFILALRHRGLDNYWFNTLPLYVMGMVYSWAKEPIEKCIMKNEITYTLCIAATAVLYYLTKSNAHKRLSIYILWSVMFVCAILLATMKIRVTNPLLHWFGEHLFGIYILHRIPMAVLVRLGIAESHKYVFYILVFAVSVAMAAVFDTLTGKLQARIWKPKTAK